MSNAAPVASGKDWAKQLIELYREGCSDAEVASEMKITIKEYYQQIAENATFAKLVEFGRTLSLAYWEGLARKNIANKQFNSPLYAFYMKNKHNWADKIETKSEVDGPDLDLDKLREKVMRDTAKFIERNTPELTDAKRVLADIKHGIEEEGKE